MWEFAKPTSRGGISARRILTYALASLLAAFLWVLVASPTVFAADATWNGASLTYEGNQYILAGTAKGDESHGIPAGSTYYSFVKIVSERPLVQEAYLIYFASGTDPPAATSAEYAKYDFANTTFSNVRDKKTITIDVQSASTGAGTTCAIEGIGWAVCQITSFLAGGMDFIFTQISGFMVVQPATVGNTNSALYIAWNVVRGIANIAFIIVFLIIIYSQLTTIGVSNYGIKKLLPRLIIGAILVNLSFYICAIAIDISNVLGYAVQDVLMGITSNLFNNGTNEGGSMVLGWASMAGFVLSGGTAALAGGIAIGSGLWAIGGNPVGLIYIILPALLALILALLVVLVILAARQAIITILLIIAPLAFVAYLLPNTEKWFEKWRDLFMTMLIFFPAFALVFGGSQLAGTVIIMNANSINVILLGMIVQVAPLILTPLLLKLSGGLLGRIAGFVNDPRKGLMDRTRTWADGHKEALKYEQIGRKVMPFNLGARVARNLEYRKNRLARRTELGKQKFDNYAVNRQQTDRFDQRREVNIAQEKIRGQQYEERFNVAMEEQRAGKTDMLDRLRDDKGATLYNKAINFAERKVAPNRQARLANVATQSMVELDTETRHLASAKVSAQLKQQERYATFIKNESLAAVPDIGLRSRISGIDDNGFQRAMANAVASLSKIREETIGNMEKIIMDSNATKEEIRELSKGISVRGIAVTQDSQAAALKLLLGGGDQFQIAKALEEIDFSFAGKTAADREELQVVAAEALEGNAARPPQFGGGGISNLKQGRNFEGVLFTRAYGIQGVQNMILDAVNREKIDSGKLQVAGKDYADVILATVLNNPGAISATARARLLEELNTTLDPSRDSSQKLGDSKSVLEEIRRRL